MPPSRIGGHAGRAPFSRRERDRARIEGEDARITKRTRLSRERYGRDRGVRDRRRTP